MGVGSFFSFFVFHKKLWIYITDADGSTEVRIGAMINKNKMALEKDIKELEASIKGKVGKGPSLR